jgi:hypothetical protein
MADTIRKLILDALKTSLEGITVANGYHTDVTTVEIAAKPWNEVPPDDMPWIGIIPDVAAPTDQIGYVDYEWTINLLAHQIAASTTPIAVSEACDNIRNDIRKCLYSVNPSLDVDGVILIRMGTDEASEGAPEASAAALASSLIPIIVLYQEAITA